MSCDHQVICFHTNKIDEYGKTWVICDHLVVHVRTNKLFLHLINAGFCIIFACIGYFRGFFRVHYSSLLVVLLVFVIGVRGSVKLVRLK